MRNLKLGDLIWTLVVWLVAQTVLALIVGALDLGGRWLVLPLLGLPLFIAGAMLRASLRANGREHALQMSATVTRSGFRLVPASPGGPIICLETDPARVPAAELEFALERELPRESTWRLEEQSLQVDGTAVVDVLVFASESGARKQLAFDVSRSRLFS